MTPDMPEYQRLKQDATVFRSLMDQATRPGLSPSEAEHGAILRHQLDAPLAADVRQFFANTEEALSGVEQVTFRDLLLHPHPPLAALQLVKDFAKQLSRQSEYAYPKDVAMVLYYLCLAAAEVRANASITQLPRAEVEHGVRWVLDQSWIPDDLRSLLTEALNQRPPATP